jgi:hypothetical protein
MLRGRYAARKFGRSSLGLALNSRKIGRFNV